MTQNQLQPPSQPATAEELWAAYDGQKQEEEALHQRWQKLSARYQAAAERANGAYERSRSAYNAYVAVYERRAELFDAAMAAQVAQDSKREVKLAA